MQRRALLKTGATLAAVGASLSLSASASAAPGKAAGSPTHRSNGDYLKLKDGTNIYYKDWGKGQPIVLSHGWPLSADAWESQMFFLGQRGYRVIAYDRRGHGRSSQPWEGYDNNTFADDLAEIIDQLELRDIVLVAHSMGGGETARYVGRHGTSRLSKMVFISCVVPWVLKGPKVPNGVPMSAFDGIRAGIAGNRAQFYKDVSQPFFGYNKPGAKASEGLLDEFFRLGMQSSIKGTYDCVKAFSEDDFTDDLEKIDKPTLFIHGEEDQIVPIAASSALATKIVKNSIFKPVAGAPHGLCNTHADQVNNLLLDFVKT